MDADELSSALRRRKVRVLHPGRESVHEAPVTKGKLPRFDRVESYGLCLVANYPRIVSGL